MPRREALATLVLPLVAPVGASRTALCGLPGAAEDKTRAIGDIHAVDDIVGIHDTASSCCRVPGAVRQRTVCTIWEFSCRIWTTP